MSYLTDSFKKFLCVGLSDHSRKMCIPIRYPWENLQLKSSPSRYHRLIPLPLTIPYTFDKTSRTQALL